MSSRTPGPFAYERPDGPVITASVEEPARHARALQQLAVELGRDEDGIRCTAEGGIVTDLVQHPRSARDTAETLGLNGLYAVACVRMYGGIVGNHNDKVEDLNERHARDVRSATHAADFEDTPANRSQAAAAARAALSGEYATLLQHLETDVEEVAGYLRQGATARNVVSLTVTGLLPMEATSGHTRLQREANELLGEWFGSEFGNVFGNGDDFPLVQLATAMGKMTRMARGVAPIFQTGLVGRMMLSRLEVGSGAFASAARWLNSGATHRVLPKGIWKAPYWATRPGGKPGWSPLYSGGRFYGLGATKALGIAGGVVGTGMGIHNLVQQGNPVEAFEREGAGYVADVAETAFNGSTTAFLVAPTPVFAAAAVGSGLVWAGAEVWDHKEEIAQTASAAWDEAGDFVDDPVDTVKGWFD